MANTRACKMKSIKGVVVEVDDNTMYIRTIRGEVISLPHQKDLQLGDRLIILYNYTNYKVRGIEKERQTGEHTEQVERHHFSDDNTFDGELS